VVEAEIYLIEARSLGGLSGSPVFVLATAGNKTAVRLMDGTLSDVSNLCPIALLFLLGLAKGHWEVNPEDLNELDWILDRRKEVVSLGIAVVVPAKKIKEVLNHPELIEARNQTDQLGAESRATSSK
jgi:hypothetical protein